MAGKRGDTEIRARAIADLQSGDQPAIVAERYKLDARKVRMWKTRYVAEIVAPATAPATVIVQPALIAQQLEIGDLVLASLRARLYALQRIAEHVSLAQWLEKQDAAQLAELVESLDRSAVAILDRMAGAGRRGGDDSGAD